MNKLCYRILFNKTRGQLMAVAESAKAQGKGADGGASERTRGAQSPGEPACWAHVRTVALGLWAALGMVAWSMPTSAQIVPDANAPATQRPTVLSAPNGVPIVNIQTPSAAGVSRNTYTQFDVTPQGVVLNNARNNVQTLLGGWVQGNPWLAAGSARVILNEVNSNNPSLLRGYIEVAGQRAQVVIANPAGVSCDGCGFINANRATLTTGTPIVNGGSLDGYRVQGGVISITGTGMDASTTDYTDLIARAVQINAGLWANTVKVTAGANEVNADHTSAQPINGSGPTPAIAIDVSQLGGMYAGKITLVGTEAGVGVRNAGALGAGAGDVVITADGRIDNTGRINSSSNTQIATHAGILNSGSVYAQGNATLNAGGNIENTGLIAAQNDAQLTARGPNSQINNAAGATLVAGVQSSGQLGNSGVLELNADGRVVLHGQSFSGGDQRITAQALDLSNAQVSAANLALTAHQGDVDASGAVVSVAQTLAVVTPQSLRTNLAAVSASQLQIAAHDLSNRQGQIVQVGAGDLNLAVAGQVDNTQGRLATNSDNVSLQASTLLNTNGSIEHAGQGNFTLNASSLAGQQGQIVSNGALSLTADSATLDAAITVARQLSIQSDTLSNRAGSVIQTGAGATSISASTRIDNTGGVIASNGTTTVTTDELLNQSGILQAAGATTDLVITVRGALNNGVDNVVAIGQAGQISAGGNVAIDAGSLDNTQGRISAGQALRLQTSQGLINTAGLIAADQALSVQAAQIDNRGGTLGSVHGEASLTSTVGTMDNTGGRIEAARALHVDARGLQNTTGTIAASSIAIDSHSLLLNNRRGAMIASGATDAGDITISSGALNNDSGLIQAHGRLSANTHGQTLANAHTLSSGGLIGQGGVHLETGNLDNQQGYLASGADLTVQSTSIDNTHSGTLVGMANVTLASGALANQGGQIQALGDVQTHITNTLDNSGGLIRSAQSVSVEAAQLVNANTLTTGQGLEGQTIRITSALVNNTHGAMRADDTLVLTSSGAIDNTQGLISAGGTVSLQDPSSASRSLAVTNTAGTLIAGQQLSIDAARLSGDGALLSQGDLNVSLTQNYTHTGTLQANGIVQFETAGTLTNQAVMEAGTALNVSAATIDNQASGTFSATSVHLTATDSHTLTNRGLIDGQETVIETQTLNNLGTGRIYGDHVAIAATTLTNAPENGSAPVIAARNRLDVGATTINNQEHALLFSAGDLAIGGALDTNKQATGQAATLNNASATIEALGNLRIAAGTLNNTNEHFSTTVVTVGSQSIVEYQGKGSPTRYAPGTPDVYIYNDESDHLHTPEGNFEEWFAYGYTRTTTETQVQSSDPAKILAGGAMALSGNTLLNDKSQIIAGGTLSAAVGTLTNTDVAGEHTVTDAGSVTSFWREHRSGRDRTGNSTTGYNPPATIQSISLSPTVYAQNTAPSGTGTQLVALTPAVLGIKPVGAATVTTAVTAVSAVSPITQVNVPSAPSASGAGTVVRTGGVNASVPNNSLFHLNPNPQSHYLVETDPRFADYRQWLSSDYMLKALSLDPATTQQRLGDGFYEQKLLREQVAMLTGRRFLEGYASDEMQYQALMNAGVTYAQAHGLRPGVALNAEQMAQLTSDIVWLVEKDVALPDGRTVKALAPQLYVRVQEGDLAPTGALIAGNNVNLDVTGDLVNGGTIAGRNVVALTAENVRNLGGRITGNDVAVQARTDLDNLGGQISASNTLALLAGRDLNVTSTTRTQSNAQGSRTILDQVAGLYVTGGAGTLLAMAGRDATFNAAEIVNSAPTSASAGSGTATNTTTIVANNNLSLGTVTESQNQRIVWDSKNFRSDRSSTDVGTTVHTQGDIVLQSGQDMSIKAGSITSENGALVASAGRDLQLLAGEQTVALDESHKHTSQGFLSKRTVSTHDTLEQNTAVVSELSAERIVLSAGQDLRSQGASVVGTQDVTLVAGRNVELTTAAESSLEVHQREEKKSGVTATRNSIGYGKSSGKDNFNERTATTVGTTVGSLQGDVSIAAGKNLTVQGSDLIAGGNLLLSAQEVAITTAAQTREMQESHERKSSGISISVVGTAQDTHKNLKDALNRPGTTQKVDGVVNEVAASGSTMPQTALNFNRSEAHSNAHELEVTQRGSTLAAGGDLQIVATGTGARDAAGRALDGNLDITGAQLSAGRTARLQAAGNVTLQAANNTFEASSDAGSKSLSVTTALASVGDTTRHITGGPNNSGVKASPYNSSRARDDSADHRSQQTATTIDATDIGVSSQAGDITLIGAQLAAKNDLALRASLGRIDVLPGAESQSHRETHGSKTVGDLGSSNGTSNTIGVRTAGSSADSTLNQNSTVRSALSAGNDISVNAKQDVTLRGADVTAGNDIAIRGENVLIAPGQDRTATNTETRQRQVGTTAALSGWAVEAAQAAKRAINTMENRDAQGNKVEGGTDKRLAAIDALKAGLTAYNGAQSTSSYKPQWPSDQSAASSSTTQNASTSTSGTGGAPTAQAPSNSGSAAVKITVSVGSQSAQSETHSAATGHQGSVIQAGGDATIVATGDGQKDAKGNALNGDLTVIGSQIHAKNVALIAARDLALKSATDTSRDDSRNRSSAASIGVGFGLGGSQNGFTIELAAAGARGKATGDSALQLNSEVQASDTLKLESGRDTTLAGAQAKGERIEAQVGRDLTIRSVQDVETYQSEQTSSGFSASLCIPPLCFGQTVEASASEAEGKVESTYRSVREQTGLTAGSGGYDITVKRDTTLEGAVIASTADADKNRLTTGTLVTSDIQNEATYKASNSSMSLSYGSGSSMGQTLSSNLRSNLLANAQPDSQGHSLGITKSAVSVGTVTLTDEARQQEKTGQSAEQKVAALNRDTANANGAIDKIFDLKQIEKDRAYQKAVTELAQQAAPIVYKKIGDYAAEQAKPYTDAEKAKIQAEIKLAQGNLSDTERAQQQDIIRQAEQMMADNQLTYELWKDGGAAKVALHAVASASLGALSGGNALDGALTGGTNELLVPVMADYLKSQGITPENNKAEFDALMKAGSALAGLTLGAIASGGDAHLAAQAGTEALLATENNYLKHTEVKKMISRLDECKSRNCSPTEINAIYAEYRKLSESRGFYGLLDESTLADVIAGEAELRTYMAKNTDFASRSNLQSFFDIDKRQAAQAAATPSVSAGLTDEQIRRNNLARLKAESYEGQQAQNLSVSLAIASPYASARLLATVGISRLGWASLGGTIAGASDAVGQYAQNGTWRWEQTAFAAGSAAVTTPLAMSSGAFGNMAIGAGTNAANAYFQNVYYGDKNSLSWNAGLGALGGVGGFVAGNAMTGYVNAFFPGRTLIAPLIGNSFGNIVGGTTSLIPAPFNRDVMP